jgi:hypothetical protein
MKITSYCHQNSYELYDCHMQLNAYVEQPNRQPKCKMLFIVKHADAMYLANIDFLNASYARIKCQLFTASQVAVERIKLGTISNNLQFSFVTQSIVYLINVSRILPYTHAIDAGIAVCNGHFCC